MRVTNLFVPTMRDVPRDAETASHQLMLKAGMIRQSASGIYAWLPLGLQVLRRLEHIVRIEMEKVQAQEVLLGTIQSADLWRQSERYDAYGPEMLRIRDRHNREFLFGPTAEEAMTALVRDCTTSFRDMPRLVYQVQWKFRDEIRPRAGVMRGREFLMKDAYSFDTTEDAAAETYAAMKAAYLRCFAAMGLTAEAVPADSGPIGGTSHEFLVGGLEVGHIFNFGTRYSEKLEMKVATADGHVTPFMGSYGIGLSRLIAAIIETNHDEHGIIWPAEVAPYDTVLINALPNDEQTRRFCEAYYQHSHRVLYDDRDVRAGVKFAFADLLGIPKQVIVGRGMKEDGSYEVKDRRTGDRIHIGKTESAGEET